MNTNKLSSWKNYGGGFIPSNPGDRIHRHIHNIHDTACDSEHEITQAQEQIIGDDDAILMSSSSLSQTAKEIVLRDFKEGRREKANVNSNLSVVKVPEFTVEMTMRSLHLVPLVVENLSLMRDVTSLMLMIMKTTRYQVTMMQDGGLIVRIHG